MAKTDIAFHQAPPHSRMGLAFPGSLFAWAMAGLGAMALAWLAGMPGHAAAWALAVALFLSGCLAIAVMMTRHYPHPRFGGCNAVTLIRAALLAALLPPLLSGAAGGWAVALLGALALSLDGVDGWLARRSGLASAFGARFDMEVDAALALMLALHALAQGVVGAEVLLLGGMRYLFVAASLIWPWLSAPLEQRFRRKLVCVIQIAVLLLLQVPPLPADLAIWAARGATLALGWSFAVDVIWLWRRRG